MLRYLGRVCAPTTTTYTVKRQWQEKPDATEILELTKSFEAEETELITPSTSAQSSKTKPVLEAAEQHLSDVEMTDENTFDTQSEKQLDVEMKE